MSEIFFTSDTHYGHKNICRGTSSWENTEEGSSHQSTRDFDTLEDMNKAIIDGINSKVGEDDILYHLGDWSFGGKDNILLFREQIKCKNIHLIFGNHDHHIEKKGSIYRDLFKSVDYYKEMHITLGQFGVQVKYKVVLSHYAFRVWNQRHHGVLHLYGHSHGTLPDRGDRSMDVGVDTNNYSPYSAKEIIDRLSVRYSNPLDHHNKFTN